MLLLQYHHKYREPGIAFVAIYIKKQTEAITSMVYYRKIKIFAL